MANRRLMGEFLVLSPLIMLLGIAIEARTSVPTFEPYSYSTEQHKLIFEYRPYLIDSIQAIKSHDPDKIRTASANWLAALESRRIEPLKKSNYFDSGRTGVKGEIAQTFDQLANEVGRLAVKSFERGDSNGALDDIEVAIKLSNVQKIIDLDTIGYFSMRERNCFEIIGDYCHLLNREQAKRAMEIANRINVSDEAIRSCSATADRFYLIDGLRWNESRSRILDPLAKNQLISNTNRRSVNQFSITSLSKPLFEQANSMRYAISSLNVEKKALAKLKNKLRQRMKK